MKETNFFAALMITLLLCFTVIAQPIQPAENYPPHPDSMEQPNVAKGEVLKFTFESSKIFPGTWREYWVYIPAQYKPENPACVYVNQDGLQWKANTVFDNLIAKKEMPITIGVFVMHGKVRTDNPEQALDRFNRSYEYDGLGDSYARFILEEILPEVETKKTMDGRAIRLSKNGNDRAIGGSSSGAIAAFTAAWERPDAFSRVFSSIGTYVGQRGGDRYHTLLRKFEPKPLRIFLQDGANDNNSASGDWWMANQTMERSLIFAGYEVNHIWGEGSHNGKHGTAIFPDAMRYLWKDWPTAVKVGKSKNNVLEALLIPGEDWQLVGADYKLTQGPAVNAKGEVFFTDVTSNKIYQVNLDGKVSEFASNTNRISGQAFGPDDKLYAVSGNQKVVKYELNGNSTFLAEGLAGNDLVVASNGNMYVTNPPSSISNEPSKIWLIKPNGEKKEVDNGLRYANGITLSPDQTLLYVPDTRSHWIYSYKIQPDGTLQDKQKFYWLMVPDNADDSGAGGMRVDREGRLYVATRYGIQICDQAGRVNAIIPTPNSRVSNLNFGGENFDTLFATCGDKVYKRKLKVRGAHNWEKPIKPAPPRL